MTRSKRWYPGVWLLFALVCVMFSCREDFYTLVPETQPTYSLFAELSPGAPVEVVILSNAAFGSESTILHREDADLNLTGSGMQGKQIPLAYDEERQRYLVDAQLFKPREKGTYEIKAMIPGAEMDTLKSRTYIPAINRIKDISIVSNTRYRVSDQNFNHLLKVVVTLNDPVEIPAYFQLIPRRAISEFRIGQNGNVHITDSGEYENMEITAINAARNAVNQLVHTEGLFVDFSRLDGQRIEFSLTLRRPLSEAKDILDRIQFELRSLSPELFAYHIQLHRRKVSQQADYSYAITGYTNIDNGNGVFGSFSSSYTSVKLK